MVHVFRRAMSHRVAMTQRNRYEDVASTASANEYLPYAPRIMKAMTREPLFQDNSVRQYC